MTGCVCAPIEIRNPSHGFGCAEDSSVYGKAIERADIHLDRRLKACDGLAFPRTLRAKAKFAHHKKAWDASLHALRVLNGLRRPAAFAGRRGS